MFVHSFIHLNVHQGKCGDRAVNETDNAPAPESFYHRIHNNEYVKCCFQKYLPILLIECFIYTSEIS